MWSTACPDWERRIVAGESLIPFAPLFPAEATASLNVFKSLRVTDLPGKPTFGECAGQWVFDFVGAIFGAYDEATAQRLIEESLLLISKKNSKSTLAAGIMLTALIRNWRFENAATILAPTIEVANNAYGPAAGMVRADAKLSALLHIQDNIRRITHRHTDAFLKVLAADSETVGGSKSAFNLVDELWLFGKKPGADAMLKEALGGLASRPEGFAIFLSTQSDEPPAGVFKQKLELYRSIRDGSVVDNKKLPVLYEFPRAMVKAKGYLDPSKFYITNPNLGRSVRQDWLESKLIEAKSEGPQGLALHLSKHLNVEIGMNLRADRWAGADYWAGAVDSSLAPLGRGFGSNETLQAILARSDVVVMGADGGGLDDLLGLAVFGRDATTKEILGWFHAWAHASVLERRKEIAPRLLDFEKAGDLTIVEELGQDTEELQALFAQVDATGLLWKLGVDPAGVGAIIEAAEAAGIEDKRRVGISQGWKLTGAIKTLERDLASRRFRHAGQPMMAWCVGNAKVEPRGNAVTITKQMAGTAKIDPLMAGFNATSLMALNPATPTISAGFFDLSKVKHGPTSSA